MAWELTDVNPHARRLLLEKTGHDALSTDAIPELVQRAVFREPLWLMQGRVDQLWRSAERYSHDLGAKPEVLISSAPTVNAYAVLHPEHPVISLSAGACVRIRQMMQLATYPWDAFRRPHEEEFIPADVAAESFTATHSREIVEPLTLDPHLPEEHYMNMIHPLPYTMQRMKLASAMTTAALDFMVMHELSHLLRHQSKFFESPQRQAFFMETEPQDAQLLVAQGSILRQLLELDADIAAAPINSSMGGISGDSAPVWHEWTNDSNEVTGLWLTALALTFSLLDAWSIKQGVRNTIHPPAGVRLLTILSANFNDRVGIEEGTDHMPNSDLALILTTLDKAAHIGEVIDLPIDSTRLIIGRERLIAEYRAYMDQLIEYGVREKPTN